MDGLGALVSALFLVVIAVHFENHFGVHVQMLYILAILSCLLALLDLYCFTKIKKDTIVFLRIIAYLNIVYCCIAFGLAVFYHQEITYLGSTYVFLEIVIVTSIACLEFRTADFVKKAVQANKTLGLDEKKSC